MTSMVPSAPISLWPKGKGKLSPLCSSCQSRALWWVLPMGRCLVLHLLHMHVLSCATAPKIMSYTVFIFNHHFSWLMPFTLQVSERWCLILTPGIRRQQLQQVICKLNHNLDKDALGKQNLSAAWLKDELLFSLIRS